MNFLGFLVKQTLHQYFIGIKQMLLIIQSSDSILSIMWHLSWWKMYLTLPWSVTYKTNIVWFTLPVIACYQINLQLIFTMQPQRIYSSHCKSLKENMKSNVIPLLLWARICVKLSKCACYRYDPVFIWNQETHIIYIYLTYMQCVLASR